MEPELLMRRRWAKRADGHGDSEDRGCWAHMEVYLANIWREYQTMVFPYIHIHGYINGVWMIPIIWRFSKGMGVQRKSPKQT